MKVLKFGFLMASSLALCAHAADYYVGGDNASDDNAGGAESPFATIDKAVITVRTAGDVIHVRPGTYETTLGTYDSDSNSKWGPNLCVKMIGEGATRDEVVLKSHGTHRTLRMAANSWVENLTLEGEPNFKADKGGVLEMSGGTLTNCVVRNGTAKNGSGSTEGGCIYMSGSSLVVDCVISGGKSNNRGGNVYVDGGVMRNCTISDGYSANVGGNMFLYGGTVEQCTITGGSCVNDGGNVRQMGTGVLQDSTISGGTITTGSEKKGVNIYVSDSGKISRCQLTGGQHQASYDGASLCVYSDKATVEDCLIKGSACGGILLGSSNSKIYNTTIVDNIKFAVWSWNANQTLVNCVFYGNKDSEGGNRRTWSGNQPTGTNAQFLNCAGEEGDFSTDTHPSFVVLDSSAFVDYDNGDFRPAEGGALVDAGHADPRGSTASTTDLDGNPRQNDTVDIGCYEFQKQEMAVRITGMTLDRVYAPAVATFTHTADHTAASETVTYTYDFGDGSEPVTVTAATVSHTYANPGVYTVKITAVTTSEEESAEMTYPDYAQIASTTIYVKSGNTASAFPYNTPETGYANLKTALQASLDGYTILVQEGVYADVDQFSVNKAITVRGLGETPEGVIVRNSATSANTYYHRTMEVTKEGAWVENLTLENGKVMNQYGGNLRLAAGVVSNCVIRGGLAVVDGSGNAGGAGVELGGAATLTHCVISNNVTQGTSNNGGYTGGAGVMVAYNAKNGRISNNLVCYNHYVTSGETVKSGAAGIRLVGGNDNTQIENNTVVANVVEGNLNERSAGLYCTTWYGRVRNNIVAGNSETGREGVSAVQMDIAHGTYVNNLTDEATPQTADNFVSTTQAIFKDFAKGDFTLKTGCVAVNNGTTSGLTLLPTVDLAGNPRIFDGSGKSRIDIGCYECQKIQGFVVDIR